MSQHPRWNSSAACFCSQRRRPARKPHRRRGMPAPEQPTSRARCSLRGGKAAVRRVRTCVGRRLSPIIQTINGGACAVARTRGKRAVSKSCGTLNYPRMTTVCLVRWTPRGREVSCDCAIYNGFAMDLSHSQMCGKSNSLFSSAVVMNLWAANASTFKEYPFDSSMMSVSTKLIRSFPSMNA
jgi:hypothetical protein